MARYVPVTRHSPSESERSTDCEPCESAIGHDKPATSDWKRAPMYATPIFDRIHDVMFPDQCEKCRDAGWPIHLFVCIADDPTCTDY